MLQSRRSGGKGEGEGERDWEGRGLKQDKVLIVAPCCCGLRLDIFHWSFMGPLDTWMSLRGLLFSVLCCLIFLCFVVFVVCPLRSTYIHCPRYVDSTLLRCDCRQLECYVYNLAADFLCGSATADGTDERWVTCAWSGFCFRAWLLQSAESFI